MFGGHGRHRGTHCTDGDGEDSWVARGKALGWAGRPGFLLGPATSPLCCLATRPSPFLDLGVPFVRRGPPWPFLLCFCERSCFFSRHSLGKYIMGHFLPPVAWHLGGSECLWKAWPSREVVGSSGRPYLRSAGLVWEGVTLVAYSQLGGHWIKDLPCSGDRASSRGGS